MIFDEPTPRELIAALLPDVLVKGADWGAGEIVGRAGSGGCRGQGCVSSRSRLEPGNSTTEILDKDSRDLCGKSLTGNPLMLESLGCHRATVGLASVARHPAVDEASKRCGAARRKKALPGSTDPVKALAVAIVASELRRPILVLGGNGASRGGDARTAAVFSLARWAALALSVARFAGA